MVAPSLKSKILGEIAGTNHAFSASLDGGPGGLVRPRQVHGARAVDAGVLRGAPEAAVEADAVWTDDPRTAVGVVSADCVPLLLARRGGERVAAVHAGWRGLAAGVVEAAVAALGRADRLVAALGPAASGEAYEVGPEVLAALAPAGARRRPTRAGHALLDLRGVCVDRLTACGVAAERIEVVGPCTISTPGWPSYRRQGDAAGRILSWVRPGGAEERA
jgi:hypothetical protein